VAYSLSISQVCCAGRFVLAHPLWALDFGKSSLFPGQFLSETESEKMAYAAFARIDTFRFLQFHSIHGVRQQPISWISFVWLKDIPSTLEH
jgi:hypothetical protein